MSKLNLKNFNEILARHLKDDKSEADLIKAELNVIGDIILDKTAQLLDELDKNGYDSEIFRQIKNIKNNSEYLVIRLMELEPMEEENG